MTHSVDQTLHQFANLLPNWTLVPISTLLSNFGGFHRTLQRVRLANRGRLLLRTPGPIPFGSCICSNVEAILSWTCHVYGPFEFRTSLGTSILLEQKREEIWLSPMKNPLHRQKIQKGTWQRKTPDFERSVGETTTALLVWLNRFTGSQLSHWPQKLWNQTDSHLKMCKYSSLLAVIFIPEITTNTMTSDFLMLISHCWVVTLVPRIRSYGIYISQLVRFARCCTSVLNFHSKNLQITSKLLTQVYRYHKLRKIFGKFFRSYSELLSKFGDISFQEYVSKGILSRSSTVI